MKKGWFVLLLLATTLLFCSCGLNLTKHSIGVDENGVTLRYDTNGTIETIPIGLGYVLEMPSEELQDRFVKEYVAYQNYDSENHPTVAIELWYGSFDDIHFVFVYDGDLLYTQAIWTDTVAGCSFTYRNGHAIKVWVNEQFLSIKEAYEQNLITADMIKVIESIHNGSAGSPIKMWEP